MTIIQHTHVTQDSEDDDILVYRCGPYKARFVANLAFHDGPEASADHYKLPLGHVYAAMAWYQDNESLIRSKLDELDKEFEESRIESYKRTEAIRERWKEMRRQQGLPEKESRTKDLYYYLPLPYTIALTPPDPKKSGDTWFAEIPDLPGCMTWAESSYKALKQLEEAKFVWLENVLADGVITIAEPDLDIPEQFRHITLGSAMDFIERVANAETEREDSPNYVDAAYLRNEAKRLLEGTGSTDENPESSKTIRESFKRGFLQALRGKTITRDELHRLMNNQDVPFELVDGVKSPWHDSMVMERNEATEHLQKALEEYLKSQPIGEVHFRPTILLSDNSWFVPDLAFFAGDRFKEYQRVIPDAEDKPYALVPDMVVEVISQEELFSVVMRQIELYEKHGVREVWVLNIETERLTVYSLGGISIRVRRDEFIPSEFFRNNEISIQGLKLP
jgi:Uma2 family endonuclease/predicted RNase H-like HicB family nuclease